MTTSDPEPSPAATTVRASAWSWHGSASAAEAAEFAEHLAALTRTGLPLPSGLRSLAAELPSRRLGRALGAMADSLDRGESLDRAMVGIASRFPAPLRGLMIAGARSGKLADVLGQYVRYADLGGELRRRFWMSIAYPIILLAALLALYLFVCFRVVTSLDFVLDDFKIDVPPPTELLFHLAEATRTRGPQVAVLAAILGVIGYAVFRLSMGPAERRMLVSSVPMFGPLLRWTSLAEFCHLTGLLVESEMRLTEALELAGRGVGDAELARAGASLRARSPTR
jgi:type II secretory pathway component PulF